MRCLAHLNIQTVEKIEKEGAGIIRPDGVAVIGNKRNVSANGILFLEMERSF